MGKISASTGGAAVPGFSFKDEPGTGSFSGGGTVKYSVNGSEVMSVDGTTLAFTGNAGIADSLPFNASNPSNEDGRMYWNSGDAIPKVRMVDGTGTGANWHSIVSGSGTPGKLAKFSSFGVLTDSSISITEDEIVFNLPLRSVTTPGYYDLVTFVGGTKPLLYEKGTSELNIGGNPGATPRIGPSVNTIYSASSEEGTGGYPSVTVSDQVISDSSTLSFDFGSSDQIDIKSDRIDFICNSSVILSFQASTCYSSVDVEIYGDIGFRCKEIVTDRFSFYGSTPYIDFDGSDVVNVHLKDGTTDSVFKYEDSKCKAILNCDYTEVNVATSGYDTVINNIVKMSDLGFRAYKDSSSDYSCYKKDGDSSGFYSDPGGWLIRFDNSTQDLFVSNVVIDTASMSLKSGYNMSITGDITFVSVPAGGDDILNIDSGTYEILINTSSRRYKKDIVDLEFDPFRVLELKPTFYTRTDSGRREFGLIAEEVYQILPQLVICKHDTGQPEAVKHELLNVLYVPILKSFNSRFEHIEKAFVFRDGSVPFDPVKHMADLRDLQIKHGELKNRLSAVSDKADKMEAALTKLEELVSKN